MRQQPPRQLFTALCHCAPALVQLLCKPAKEPTEVAIVKLLNAAAGCCDARRGCGSAPARLSGGGGSAVLSFGITVKKLRRCRMQRKVSIGLLRPRARACCIRGMGMRWSGRRSGGRSRRRETQRPRQQESFHVLVGVGAPSSWHSGLLVAEVWGGRAAWPKQAARLHSRLARFDGLMHDWIPSSFSTK